MLIGNFNIALTFIVSNLLMIPSETNHIPFNLTVNIGTKLASRTFQTAKLTYPFLMF